MSKPAPAIITALMRVLEVQPRGTFLVVGDLGCLQKELGRLPGAAEKVNAVEHVVRFAYFLEHTRGSRAAARRIIDALAREVPGLRELIEGGKLKDPAQAEQLLRDHQQPGLAEGLAQPPRAVKLQK